MLPNLRLFFLAFMLLLWSEITFAQSGGKSTFQFLNLTGSARPAALGGNAIATRTDDVTLVYQNPSQLQASMNQQMAFSYVGHPAGIKFGDIAYAQKIGKYGIYAATFHFVNYGSFDRTDESSAVLGTFNAGEYALAISWSKALDSSLFIGASLKGILSDLGDFKSNGIAADVGLTWYDHEKLWCATILAKNIGTQLKTYEDGNREPLPFEIQAGVSKQLVNAPFRFSFIAQQLQKFDLTYTDPLTNTVDPLTGEKKEEKISFANKATRHLIVNVEVLLSKNFNIRFGYNFLRRKELGFPEKKGMAGISAGFGFKVNKFNLSYARSVYNNVAGSNHFTITTSIDRFRSKK
jgi:hypothetical protein